VIRTIGGFFALNGLVGCGHMSGLVARRICPLALMKSDDRNPYQICELQTHVSQQVVLVFGGDRVGEREKARGHAARLSEPARRRPSITAARA
jgi:hypothetical protein